MKASTYCGWYGVARPRIRIYIPLTPPLARIAMALGPYLAGSRSLGNADVWKEGNALLEHGGHYQRTLTLARLGILPFFWLACFVLWRFISRNYGQWHAALAVLLFAFCPPVLANASLATTDMAVTAMFLLALVCFWEFLQEPKASSATYRRGRDGARHIEQIVGVALFGDFLYGPVLVLPD